MPAKRNLTVSTGVKDWDSTATFNLLLQLYCRDQQQYYYLIDVVFQSVTQAYSGKEYPSSPKRSRTEDLPIACSDALPLKLTELQETRGKGKKKKETSHFSFNITACSEVQVIMIKKAIIKDKMSWCWDWFPQPVSKNILKTSRRI